MSVVSDSVRPNRRPPTRLLCPWDSPGKNTGVGCHFLLHVSISSVQFSPQSCPPLCNPMNRSMPGSPVHHQLPEFTQTHVHRVCDAVQPSHPLSPLLLPPSIFPASGSFPVSQYLLTVLSPKLSSLEAFHSIHCGPRKQFKCHLLWKAFPDTPPWPGGP